MQTTMRRTQFHALLNTPIWVSVLIMILNHLKKLCVVLLQTRAKTLKNVNVNIFKILLFDLLSDYIIFCGSTFGPVFFI